MNSKSPTWKRKLRSHWKNSLLVGTEIGLITSGNNTVFCTKAKIPLLPESSGLKIEGAPRFPKASIFTQSTSECAFSYTYLKVVQVLLTSHFTCPSSTLKDFYANYDIFYVSVIFDQLLETAINI